jgi:hypothetical protein
LFRSGPSVAGPFVGRCLTRLAVPRFHLPLIEPDKRICRIRLSEKASRVRPRKALSQDGAVQTHQHFGRACDTATDAACPAREQPRRGRPERQCVQLVDELVASFAWSCSAVYSSWTGFGVARLIANLRSFATCCAASNQGPFPPPALPGFGGTTDPSATLPGPACPSRASG